MALADDIRALRDRTLAELVADHDYFVDSEQAWVFVARAIVDQNRTFTYANPVTGTTTTQVELADRIVGYATDRLLTSTFLTFLAVFEAFVGDLLRAWLRAHPKALSDKSPVPADVVLDATDRTSIIDFMIDRAVTSLFYKKPADWFEYLEGRLTLGCPSADEIERLAEAKATRDVLVHNRGVVNDVYVKKVTAARRRFAVGEQVDIPDSYHRETWELLRKIVTDLSAAFLAKFP